MKILTKNNKVIMVDGQAIAATGDSATSVEPKYINFYDYDGTILYSWTSAELKVKTALPDLPSHAGLICEGWNWTLAALQENNVPMNVGAMYVTDDNTTRVYIHLEEGRLSPMLGVCPNGTATIDWGDGSTTDTLTGTNTRAVKWTPTHNYAAPGDYMIKISYTNKLGFSGSGSSNQNSYLLRYASGADVRNYVYQNAIKKIELGPNIDLRGGSFMFMRSLESVTIPNTTTTEIGDTGFSRCSALKHVNIPSSIIRLKIRNFEQCTSLQSISLPQSLVELQNSGIFQMCLTLHSITLPPSLTTVVTTNVLSNLQSLTYFRVPLAFNNILAGAFQNCYALKTLDFTSFTSVPTLANTTALSNIPDDCEIRVPGSLLTEWKAATNWVTYADKIVGV